MAIFFDTVRVFLYPVSTRVAPLHAVRILRVVWSGSLPVALDLDLAGSEGRLALSDLWHFLARSPVLSLPCAAILDRRRAVWIQADGRPMEVLVTRQDPRGQDLPGRFFVRTDAGSGASFLEAELVDRLYETSSLSVFLARWILERLPRPAMNRKEEVCDG